MRWRTWCIAIVGVCVLFGSGGGSGGNSGRWLMADPPVNAAANVSQARPADQSSEHAADQNSGEFVGIRLTPRMVRGFAKALAVDVFKRQYELPDSKVDEAAEKIARRLMATAHAIDGPGQEFFQEVLAERLMAEVDGGGEFFSYQYGKKFADQALEYLPLARDLVRDIGQDIRPMLPFKQQLKFVRDLMGVKIGMDAFEQTMQKWSNGEVTDLFEFFFEHSRGQDSVQKDESGQTVRLKRAREQAQQVLDVPAEKRLGDYAEKFKAFYGLDAAASGTVDSIIREFVQRAEQNQRNEDWRQRVYRGFFLLSFYGNETPWHSNSNSIATLADDDFMQARSWWPELQNQFKARLDTVPTTSQRQAAKKRIAALCEEKGISAEEFEEVFP